MPTDEPDLVREWIRWHRLHAQAVDDWEEEGPQRSDVFEKLRISSEGMCACERQMLTHEVMEVFWRLQGNLTGDDT